MNDKRARFVQEYAVDLNGTQAAIRAGYSKNTARQIADELLSIPDVAEAVEEAKKAAARRVGLAQDAVLTEIATLSLSSIDNYEIDDSGKVTLKEGAPGDAMRAVSSIKRRVRTDKDGAETIDTEIRLWDKPAALRMAGQHLSLFTERHEVTGRDGGPLVVTVKLVKS